METIINMSKEMPNILFLGRKTVADQIRTMIEPFGGYVYTPHALLDTLGMVVSYEPDLILLDATDSPALAESVAAHLETIDVPALIVHGEGEWLTALTELFPSLAFHLENHREGFHA